jgi:hypothetical protein
MNPSEIAKQFKERDQKTYREALNFKAKDTTEIKESHYYYQFESESSDNITIMTGFSGAEFMGIFAEVRKDLEVSTRGKRPDFSSMDALFFTLVYLKHYEPFDTMGEKYNVQPKCLRSTILRTLDRIEKTLITTFITTTLKETQEEQKMCVPNFPEVGLMAGIYFQSRWKSKSCISSSFSKQNMSHGFKVATAHLPNGEITLIGRERGGALTDYEILFENISAYSVYLTKRPDIRNLTDFGEMWREHSNQWALLLGKEFIDLDCSLYRIIAPKSISEESATVDEVNENIQRTRNICKAMMCSKFYGRMKVQFRIMSECFRGHEGDYAQIFRICAALTNFHIQNRPLIDEDEVYYQYVLDKYKQEGESKKRKQCERNARYQNKHAKL